METNHFLFGTFRLDPSRDALYRDGAAIAVGHRAVLLLQALLQARGQVVTKAELMDAAWPGLIVEESNLSVQVAALRKLLGPSPEGGDWIATVARVGYRFTGSVTPVGLMEGDERSSGWPAGAKPTIVVLPFVNMGGGPERDYLSDGITEDIITALTRFRWFCVIGRNSSFAFKGRTVGAQEVARELNVRYVLEGSVRQTSQQVRITAQLIEAATASQIWAERYDFLFDEMLAVQDTIAHRVAGAIEPELLKTVSALAAAQNQKGSVTAWDLVHRGAWHFHQVNRAGHTRARQIFRQACAADHNFAPAHVWLARVNAGMVAYGWTDDREADLHEGIEAAFTAIRLDEKNPYAHYALAITSVYGCTFDQAIRAAKRAVELSQSFALGHLVLGMAHLFSGAPAAALKPLEQGLEINPFDPQNFVWYNTLAYARLFSGQPERAFEAAEHALKIRPDWKPAIETAACCVSTLGDQERFTAYLMILADMKPSAAGDALEPMRRNNPNWATSVADVLSGATSGDRVWARLLTRPTDQQNSQSSQ